MTRTLGNGSVELELGSGSWTARWASCGVVVADCTADVDCLSWEPESMKGSWRVETTRTGARARWTHADGSAWLEWYPGEMFYWLEPRDTSVPVGGRSFGMIHGPGIGVHTNARGFRGTREVDAMPSSRTRVICSGDSFTFG